MRRAVVVLGASLLLSGPADADVVHLVTGSSHECVIRKVTDEWVTYETALGVASLPRYKVVAITRDPDETNMTLRKGWQAARAAKEARERARARKAVVERLTQKALGNVKYQGEWMTPEERDARVAALKAAQEAAAALSRREAAAGHHFHYGVWMTDATYRAVIADEEMLRGYQDRFVELQNQVALLQDQIDGARMFALQEGDLESMEKRAEQAKKLRADQAAAAAELLEVRDQGDTVAARIERYVKSARQRLRDILAERGAPPAALDYLADVAS